MSQQTAQFNYAGLQTRPDTLPELKLEEGKSTLVSFLNSIPGMQNPPFVYCKVHWNSEMGENGRMFQCWGGSCCQQVTWQKGWGGAPGKFEAHKARTRFYIPIVHYEPDQANPAMMRATIKYLNITYTAYDALIKAIQNTTEGLDFFDRDITIEAQKVNGAMNYLYHKKESQAQWKTNQVFKQEVEEQLPTVATKLFNSLPMQMTEEQFLEMKPQLDAKVQQAIASHQQPQQPQFAQPMQQQLPFAQMPGAQPVQQFAQMPGVQPVQTANFTQPQVNIPVQPIPQTAGVDQVPQTTGVDTGIQQVPVQAVTTAEQTQQVEVTQTEVPKVDLSFDPNVLLK